MAEMPKAMELRGPGARLMGRRACERVDEAATLGCGRGARERGVDVAARKDEVRAERKDDAAADAAEAEREDDAAARRDGDAAERSVDADGDRDRLRVAMQIHSSGARLKSTSPV